MSDINITISDQDNVKVAAFAGQLDESNVDEQWKTIYELIENNTPLLAVFDFSGLEYLNSKAIGYLTDTHLKVSEGGGKLVVAASKDNVMDILDVVGLTQVIEIADTVDEGIKTCNE